MLESDFVIFLLSSHLLEEILLMITGILVGTLLAIVTVIDVIITIINTISLPFRLFTGDLGIPVFVQWLMDLIQAGNGG